MNIFISPNTNSKLSEDSTPRKCLLFWHLPLPSQLLYRKENINAITAFIFSFFKKWLSKGLTQPYDHVAYMPDT